MTGKTTHLSKKPSMFEWYATTKASHAPQSLSWTAQQLQLPTHKLLSPSKDEKKLVGPTCFDAAVIPEHESPTKSIDVKKLIDLLERQQANKLFKP